MAKEKHPFRLYHEYVGKRLKKRWKPKPGMGGVHVEFKIGRDGNIHDLRIKDSCKDPEYDQAALDAVAASAPFKPIPPELTIDEFPVSYMF